MIALGKEKAILFGGLDGYLSYSDTYIFSLAESQWTEVLTKTHPCARFGHSLTVWEDKAYLFGGWDGKYTLNDLWEFSSEQGWTLVVKHSSVAPRYRHTAVTFKHCMVVFGGVDSFQTRFNDMHIFSYTGRVWTRVIVPGVLPTPRTFHKAVVLDKHLLVLGGFDGDKLADAWRLDLALTCFDSWSQTKAVSVRQIDNALPLFPPLPIPNQNILPASSVLLSLMEGKEPGKWLKLADHSLPNSPEERTGHGLAFCSDTLYLIGGVNSRSVCLTLSCLDAFDVKNCQWSRRMCTGECPTARSSMQYLELERGQLFFFGGYFVEEYYNDVFILDLFNLTWTRVSSGITEVARRAYCSLVYSGDYLFVYGGRNKTDIFNDLTKLTYNSENRRITAEKVAAFGEAPKERFGHSAVVSGRSMFLFGGWDGKKCLNDFFEFSIESNIWYNVSLYSTGLRPSPRYRLDASEVSGRLYFFGGVNHHHKKFNTLLEYDPYVREWSVLTCTGDTPSPRSFLRLLAHHDLLILAGGVDERKRNDLYIVRVPVRPPPSIRKKSTLSVVLPEASPIENPGASLAYYRLLNEQILELSKKLKDEQISRLCKICRGQEIDSVYLECCHCVACFNCAQSESLVSYFDQCLICKSPVIKTIKTYSNR